MFAVCQYMLPPTYTFFKNLGLKANASIDKRKSTQHRSCHSPSWPSSQLAPYMIISSYAFFLYFEKKNVYMAHIYTCYTCL